MVDSLYYSSRKIPETCENCLVDYRINYQKLFNEANHERFELSHCIAYENASRKGPQYSCT